MRVAFVILCCALQYITSEIIDDEYDNILNDKNKYETKNETTSDEFEIDPNTGKVVEKLTTHKEFLLKNGCGSDVDEGDVKIIHVVITKDGQGRERISEEDTTIKKVPETTINGNVGISVPPTSSSSASAASQTPQSNSNLATGSAASASTSSSNADSCGIATVAGPQGEASEKSATAAVADNNFRTYGNSYGLTSIVGPNVSQGPYTIIQNINPLSSSSSSIAPTGSKDPEKIIIENINYPGPGPAGSPDASPTTKGASSSAASAASGEPGLGTTAASAAAASAATVGAGSDSSSESAAETQGPTSGSTSAASSSSTPSDAGGLESISGTQESSNGSEEGDAYGNGSGRGGVYQPYGNQRPKLIHKDKTNEHGFSVSPDDSSTIKGDKTGTQRPEITPVSKLARTAPGNRPTGLDFYRGSYYEENYSGSQVSIINNNSGGFSTSSSAASATSGGPGLGTTAASAAAASAATGGAGSASSAASAAGTQGPASGSTSAASSSSTRSDAGGSGSISDIQESSEGSEEDEAYGNGSERGGVYQPYGNQRPNLIHKYKTKGHGSSDSPRHLNPKKGDKTGTQRPENKPVSNQAGTATGKRPTMFDFYGPGYFGEYDVPPQRSITNYYKGSSVTSSSAASAASGEPGLGTTAASAAAASAATGGAGSASSAESAAGTQGPASGPTSAASSSSTQESSEGSEEGEAYGNGSGRGGVYQPYGNQRPNLFHKYKTKGHGSSDSPRDLNPKKGDKTKTQRLENKPVSNQAGTAPRNRPTGLDFYDSGYYAEYDIPPQRSITNYNKGSSVTSSSAASAASGEPGLGTTAASAAAASAATGGAGSASSAKSAAGTQGSASGSTSAASSSSTPSDAGGPESISGTQKSSNELIHKHKTKGHGSSGSPRDLTTKKGDETGTQRPEITPVSKLARIATGKRPTVFDFYGPGYYGEYDVPPQRSITDYNRASSATSSFAASATSGGPGLGTTAASAAAASAATVGAGSASSAESAAETQGPASGSTSASSSSSTQESSEGSEEGEAYGNGSGRGGVYQPYGNQRPKLIHTDKTNEHGFSVSPDDSSTIKGDKTGIQRPEITPVSKLARTAPRNRPTGLDFYGGSYYEENYSGSQVSIINNNSGGFSTSSSAASAASGEPGLGTTAASAAAASAATVGAGSDSSADSLAETQGPASGSTSAASCSSTPSDAGGPESISGTQESSNGSKEGDAYGNGSGRGGVYKPYGNQRPKLIHKHKPKGHGSSGSPLDLTTKKEDETGTQRPEITPVSKLARIATGKRPTMFDFYGPGYYGEYGVPPQRSITDYNRASSATSSFAASATSGGPGLGTMAASAAAASAAIVGAGSASSAESAAETQGPASGSTSASSSSSTPSDAGGPESISGTQESSNGSKEGDAYGNGSGRGGVYKPYGNQRPKLIHKHKPKGHFSSGSPLDLTTKKEDETGTQRPEITPVSKLARIATGKRPTMFDFYGPGYYGEYGVPPQRSITDYNRASSATSSFAASTTSGGPGLGTTAASAAAASAATVGAGSASSAESAAETQGPASGSTSASSSSSTQESSEGSEEGEAYGNGSGRGGVYQPYGNQRPNLIHKYKTKGHGSSDSPRDLKTKKGDKSGTQRPENKPVSNQAGAAPRNRPTGLDFYDSGYYAEYDVPPQRSITNYNKGISVTSSSAASAASGEPGLGTTAASAAAASAATGGAGSASSAESAAETQGPASGSTSAASSSSTPSDAGGPESISGTQESSNGSKEGDAYGNGSGRGGVYKPYGNQRPKLIHKHKPKGHGSSGSPLYLTTKKGDETGTQRPEITPVSKLARIATGKRPTMFDFYGPGYYGGYDVPPQRSITDYNRASSATSSFAASATSGGPGLGTTAASAAAASAATVGAGSESSAESAAETQGSASGSTSASSSSSTQESSEGSEEGEAYENGSGRGGVYQPYGNQRPNIIHKYKTKGHGSSDSPRDLTTKKGDKTGAQRPENKPVSNQAGTAPRNRPTGLDFYDSGYYAEYDVPPQRSITNYNKGISVTSSSAASAASGEPGLGTTAASAAAASAATGGAGSASSAEIAAETQGPASGSTSAASSSSTPSDAGGPESISGTQESSNGSKEGDAYGNGSGRGGVYKPYGNQRPKLIHKHKTKGHGSSGSPRDLTTKKGDETGTHRPEITPVSKLARIATGKRPTVFDFYGPGYYGEYDVPPQRSITDYNRASSATSSFAASAISGGPGLGTTAGSAAAASAATVGAGSASSAESAAETQGPASGSTSAASSSSTQESSEGSEEGEAYGNGSGRGGVYQPYGNQRPNLFHKYKTKGHGSSDSPRDLNPKKGDKTKTQRLENKPVSNQAGTAPRNRPTGLDFYDSGYYAEYDIPPQRSITNYNKGSSVTSSSAASAASGEPGLGTTAASAAAASAATGGAGSASSAKSAAGTQGSASGSTSAASSSSTPLDAGGPESISGTQKSSNELIHKHKTKGHGSSGSPRDLTTKKGDETGTQRPEITPVSKLARIATGKRPTVFDFYGPGYYGEYGVPPQRSITDYNRASSATSSFAAGTTSGGPGLGTTAASAAAASAATVGAGSASSAESAAETQGPASGSTSASSSSSTQESSEGSEEGEAYGNGSGRGGVYQPYGNQRPNLIHKYKTKGHGSSDSPRDLKTKKGDKSGTQRPENKPVSNQAGAAPRNRPTGLDFYDSGYYAEYDVPPQRSITNYNKGISVTSSSAASAASGEPGLGTTAASAAAASAATGGAGSASSAESAAETQGPASGSTSAASSSSTPSDAGGPESISGTQESSNGSKEGDAYGNGSGRGGVYKPYGNQRPKLIHKHKPKGHGSSGSPLDLTTKKGDETGTQRPEITPVSKLARIATGKRPTMFDFYGPGYYGEYGVPPQRSITDYNRASSATSSFAASATSGGPGLGTTAASAAAASAATVGAGSESSAESAAETQGSASGSTSASSSSSTQESSEGSEEGEAYENGSGRGGVYQPYGNQRPNIIHKYKTKGHGSSDTPRDLTTKKGDKTGAQRPENKPVSNQAGTAPRNRPTGLDFYDSGYYAEYDVPPQRSITNYNKGISVTSSSAASAASGEPGLGTTAASAAAASAATGGAGSASSAEIAAETQGPASGSTSAASSSSTPSDAGGPESISGTQESSNGSKEGDAYGNGSGRGGVYKPYGNQRPKLIHKHKTKGHGSSGSPRDLTTKKGDETGTHRPEITPVSKLARIATGKRPTVFDFYGPGYYGEYDVPPQRSITDYNRASSATSSFAASAISGGPGLGTTAGSAAAASAATVGAGSASSAESAAETQGPASGSTSAASSSSTQESSEGSEEGEAYGNGSGRGGVYQPYGNQRPNLFHKYKTKGHGSSDSPRDLNPKKGDKTKTQRLENKPVSNQAGTAPRNRPTGLDFYDSGYYAEYDIPPQRSITNYNKGSSVTSSSAASAASGEPGLGTTAASAAAASAATGGAGSASSAKSAAGTQGSASGSTSAASSSSTPSDAGGPESISGTQKSSNELIHKHKTKGHGSSGSPRDLTTKKGDETGTQRPEITPVSKLARIATGKRPTVFDFYGPGYNGEYDVPPQRSITDYNRASSATSSFAASATSGGPGLGTTAASAAAASAATVGAGSASSAESAAETQGPASGSTSASSSSSTQESSEGSEEGEAYGNGSGRGGVYQPYGNQRPNLIHKYKTKGHGSSGSPRDLTTKKGDEIGTQRPEITPVSKLAHIATGKRPTVFDFYGPGYYGEYVVPPQRSITDYNRASSATSSFVASATSGGPGLGTTAASAAAASAATVGAGSASSAESAAETQGPASGSTSAASSSSTRSDAGGPGRISGTQESSEGSEEGDAYGNGSGRGGVYQPYGNQRTKLIHKLRTKGHGSSGSPRDLTTTKGDETGTQRPEITPVSKLARIATGNRPTGLDLYGGNYYEENYSGSQVSIINYNRGGLATSSSAASAASEKSGSTSPAVTIPESFAGTNGSASQPVDSITGNNQNELGPDSYQPGYYGRDYLAPQDLLIIEDKAVGTANNINRLKSGSSGTPSASPTTKEGVSETQQPGSGPASKPIDSITENNQNDLGPDSFGPGYYGQDYSAPDELQTIKDNERGSKSSSSPAARAPARESAARIPYAAPTRSGLASGITSVQGRKRVREACRLRSSQFVLRLGRKGQPCTFCY